MVAPSADAYWYIKLMEVRTGKEIWVYVVCWNAP